MDTGFGSGAEAGGRSLVEGWLRERLRVAVEGTVQRAASWTPAVPTVVRRPCRVATLGVSRARGRCHWLGSLPDLSCPFPVPTLSASNHRSHPWPCCARKPQCPPPR